eukprot:CAMPEP_0176484148 /NCGR_PEP_ID=MMETSP0200_2-20121128/4298_1 /TAXON_ID=947934 /ORGANISM="Chaetoceros sp., Strain GSL56" /LENGTH=556 /DNA_ID=CAMNT_0017880599 /DNA_START=299 /DNA_END=1969 /DNA_ORIENTATION=-
MKNQNTSISQQTTKRHCSYRPLTETNEMDSSVQHSKISHICCPKCHGEGQVRSKRMRTKKHKRAYMHAKDNQLPLPQTQTIRMDVCHNCAGSGVLPSNQESLFAKDDNSVIIPQVQTGTHVAIIGGGIGGLALALACQHRHIPYTVYERDQSFDERSQGYGLTMQQGGKALKALGLETTGDDRLCGKGIHSKRHIVHLPDGSRVGEWGMRVWGRPDTKKEEAKRQNVHIARQELRRLVYDHIIEKERILWGHRLSSYKEESNHVSMCFLKKDKSGNEEMVIHEASCIVGADGIRSAVRRQKIGDDISPLRYLGCIVILGIAPSPQSSDLTYDNETVFQTADGTTRLYAMPFSKRGQETAHASSFLQFGEGQGETMWQLSFPLDEKDAIDLSREGAAALKREALKRCGEWHTPIPDLLRSSPEQLISGYPVYDRDVLNDQTFRNGSNDASHVESKVTLLGDAGHPMSPFKGQGANQALLDAVLLARALYKVFRLEGKEKEYTLEEVLEEFESSMLNRSASKVKASAEAAKFLHTEAAILEGNVTRGAAAASLGKAST